MKWPHLCLGHHPLPTLSSWFPNPLSLTPASGALRLMMSLMLELPVLLEGVVCSLIPFISLLTIISFETPAPVSSLYCLSLFSDSFSLQHLSTVDIIIYLTMHFSLKINFHEDRVLVFLAQLCFPSALECICFDERCSADICQVKR